MMQDADWRLCVAPMMAWTDRHCRFFHRLIAPRARLYTEMLTTPALIHGDRPRLLGFDPSEHPVALQLGGSEPEDLAVCAAMGQDFGYDEINLNCGCPSPRVQRGAFGACLMAEPELVAESVAAMQAAVDVPVTVKCRIGIDRAEEAEMLFRFIEVVRDAGCRHFILHARKAWLDGLSPKENRTVPPLRYDYAHALKERWPDLVIVLNGGLRDPAAAAQAALGLDGVMIGREAYENPWSLQGFEAAMLGSVAPRDRHEIVAVMAEYAAGSEAPLKSVARHMLGLFNGLPGARGWRRLLSEEMHGAHAGPELLLRAAALVRPRSLAACA